MTRPTGSHPQIWPALGPTAVALTTIIALLPVVRNGFVSWDDYAALQTNPAYRGLGWAQIRWIWSTVAWGMYQPLTWMTWGLDYVLWGGAPAGYHLTSLLIHTFSVVVVYHVVQRLLRAGFRTVGELDLPGMALAASVAALFFGIHPLRAEPVAWASARGDLVANGFALLAILTYVGAVDREAIGRPRWARMLAPSALYTLSILSKPVLLTLPVVLVVLDWYPLRRLGGGRGRWFGPRTREVWLEKLPFVALALGGIVVTLLARARFTAIGLADLGLGAALALHTATVYLLRTAVPVGLSPLYERPVDLSPVEPAFLLSGAFVAALTAVVFAARRRWPAGWATWLCYGAVLAPSSGLVPFGWHMGADRYTYGSCLPWAVLLGAGILTAERAWRAGGIGVVTAVLGLVCLGAGLAGLGTLTWREVQVWQDSRTLWSYVLSVRPRSSVAHRSLGLVLEREGRLGEAVEHFRRAVAIRPADAANHVGLGRVLARQGRLPEAVAALEAALPLRAPAGDLVAAHLTLGGVLVAQGKVAAGIAHYRAALDREPSSAAVHYNLGRAHLVGGNPREAVHYLREALRLRPGFTEAEAELEVALTRLRGIGGP